tara:strand:+ start:965 stop:1405 length:441 start_codon:yes stop_codon:yes gene_type:complete
MIIDCPNCKKKFDIKDNLIPASGRLLQCSSCNFKWFFEKKTQKKESKVNIQRIYEETNAKEIPKETEEIIIEAEKNTNKKINRKKTSKISFLSLLLVILISFTALIIVLDTFKVQINSFFPGSILFLENFYETLKDFYLLIKDLIR